MYVSKFLVSQKQLAKQCFTLLIMLGLLLSPFTFVQQQTAQANTGLTIHFKKPATWGNPQLFYYDQQPTSVPGVGWDTAPLMTAETGGWFVYTIPGATSAKILFKDSNGNQIPGSGQPGLDRSSEGWYDGTTWTNVNPDAPDTEAPSVPTNLAVSELGSISVVLNWTASTDNKAVTGYEIYRDGTKIGDSLTTKYVVQTGLQPQTAYAFTLLAKDAAGNKSAQTAPVNATTVTSAELKIHFKKPTSWATPQVYYYDPIPTSVAGVTWNDAPQMTAETNGWFVYTIKDATSATIIFKDANGNQIPGASQPGLLRNKEGWYDGTVWSDTNPDIDTQAPSVPTNLAVSELGSITLKLTWTASTDNNAVSIYEIFKDGTKIGETPNTNYVVQTGLEAQTAYAFTVLAKDAAGNMSAQTAGVNATTTAYSELKIHFKKPASWATPQLFYYEEQPPSVSGTSWATAPVMTAESGDWFVYTIKGATSARVIFKDANGNQNPGASQPGLLRNKEGWYDGTAWSDINPDAPPADTQAPTAPTNLASSSVTATGLTLTWTASTDNVAVTGYDVYRGTELLGSPTTTTFNVTGLTAETAYTFTVKAKDAAANESVASNSVSVTTASAGDTVAPTAPTSLASSSVTATGLTLTWTASTDNVAVTGYDVYRGTTLVASTTTTSFNVTGLTAATAYTFTVKAKDAAANESVASNSVSVTTASAGDTVAPTVPSNVTTSNVQTTSFVVSWTASTDSVGVTGYNIYLNGAYIASTTGTSYTAKNLIAGTTYTVRILAYDAAKNRSAQSPSISVTTPLVNAIDTQAPTAPTSLASSNITNSGFKVTWGASTDNVGVTGYNVYLAGKYIATTGKREYTFTGLFSGTAYSVTILALDAAKNRSALSTPLVVSTTGTTFVDTVAPSIPTGLASSNITETGFRVNWTASTDNVGVVSYNVYRNSTYVATVSTTNYTFSGLFSGTTYTITVLASDAAKNRSALSTPLLVTTSGAPYVDTVAPSVPTNLASSNITTTGFRVSWTASTDNIAVRSYNVYRNGTFVANVSTNSYNFTGLVSNTTYNITVLAIDTSSNRSAQSTALSVKTAN